MGDFDDGMEMGLWGADGIPYWDGEDDQNSHTKIKRKRRKKTTEIDVNSNQYNTIECVPKYLCLKVMLTSSSLLKTRERYERSSLYNKEDVIIELELIHDKGNEYDNKALEVYFNRIFMGHVRKRFKDDAIDNTRVVNEFCFEDNKLSNVSIFWSGEEFYLRKISKEYKRKSNEKKIEKRRRKADENAFNILREKKITSLDEIHKEINIILGIVSFELETVPILTTHLSEDKLSNKYFLNNIRCTIDDFRKHLQDEEIHTFNGYLSSIETDMQSLRQLSYEENFKFNSVEDFMKKIELSLVSIYKKLILRISEEKQIELENRAKERGMTTEKLLEVEEKEKQEKEKQNMEEKNKIKKEYQKKLDRKEMIEEKIYKPLQRIAFIFLIVLALWFLVSEGLSALFDSNIGYDSLKWFFMQLLDLFIFIIWGIFQGILWLVVDKMGFSGANAAVVILAPLSLWIVWVISKDEM